MYSVSSGYETVLEDIMRLHEGMSPAAHIEKFELIKGDASATFPKWLEENPHAIVAMAIFDMDVYKPTKDVLGADRAAAHQGFAAAVRRAQLRVLPRRDAGTA